jgi:aspartate aminotransferase-like enzyme
MATYRGRVAYFGVLAGILTLVSAPIAAGAQPVAGKVSRVGVLGVTSAAGYARQVEAMRQGFRDLGYVEGIHP